MEASKETLIAGVRQDVVEHARCRLFIQARCGLVAGPLEHTFN